MEIESRRYSDRQSNIYCTDSYGWTLPTTVAPDFLFADTFFVLKMPLLKALEGFKTTPFLVNGDKLGDRIDPTSK